MSKNNFIIRCRGIILYRDKLLVVKHNQTDTHYALPGGHLEFGEDPRECMIREIKEELGMKAILGNLLYVHNYKEGRGDYGEIHSVEFFFEIVNGQDFVGCEKLTRSHADELAEIRWVSANEDVNILPIQIVKDLKNHSLISTIVRFTG